MSPVFTEATLSALHTPKVQWGVSRRGLEGKENIFQQLPVQVTTRAAELSAKGKQARTLFRR